MERKCQSGDTCLKGCLRMKVPMSQEPSLTPTLREWPLGRIAMPAGGEAEQLGRPCSEGWEVPRGKGVEFSGSETPGEHKVFLKALPNTPSYLAWDGKAWCTASICSFAVNGVP